ncbi:U-box domain-containing protein 9 [Abeliophyllum distichum]|uniref:RING-type E3 ubiquitin transferase n=1 Tax=Abeliophyllum distichum TaxID=126358 RepID=A0ABD1RCY3_9LAMI
MTKSCVFEGDPGMVANATELKKELQKTVKAIVDEDDINLDAVDRTQQILYALRELKLKQPISLKLANTGAVPEEFKCPISKELMRDPVIISTGQTYDRPFIENLLQAGNRTCPKSQQVLSHTILTPNKLIREMISLWCKNQGIKLPDTVQFSKDGGLTKADRDHFVSLLNKMASNLSGQREAAEELRQLTKRMPSYRALFGEYVNAVPQLLFPFSQKSSSEIHVGLQEDLITTLLNISIHDDNKKLVAENPMVIPLLMDAVRSGTVETRSNAAAALFTLSALDSNKVLIGKSGALKSLIDELDKGHPLAVKDVASAIFGLCMIHENKLIAVRYGAVQVILKKIVSRMHVDELLTILAMLSTIQKAVEEMGELEAVPCLLCIIREASCARNKENCIVVLYAICFSDRSKWKEMRDEETTYHTISQLAQNGTSRAKRKASGILERLNRPVNLIHTA